MSAADSLVSVTVLAFNHEKYIEPAIRSVLEQTHPNLEVIVVNDGSTDNTAEILNRIVDPRVRVFHQANQGPSVAANRALSECRGKYLAVMSGDDLLPPHRVARQLDEYRKGGSRILFAQAEFIDEDGNPTDTDRYRNNLTPAIGRARVLRRLFEGRAPAFILTLFTEAAILKGLSPYCDPALYQLQDYELLIRLAKKYDFCYLDEKLYRFRLRRGELNLSGFTPEKFIRTRNEFYLLMRNFFDDISLDFFKEIFADLVRKPDFSTPVEYLCEQAFVLLRSPTNSLRLLGAERLYELLKDEEGRAVLEGQYAFTHVTLAQLLQGMDTENIYSSTRLYLDTGEGFHEDLQVRIPLERDAESFDLRFDVSSYPSLRTARWDPVEGRFCKVWLDAIAYEDRSGRTIPFDMKKITVNGVRMADGGYQFDTTDPMFFLPIEEAIAAVLVRGRWSFDRAATARRLSWGRRLLKGVRQLGRLKRRILAQ
jgi:glycosyltransferase involved in cell wall biosynthesis